MDNHVDYHQVHDIFIPSRAIIKNRLPKIPLRNLERNTLNLNTINRTRPDCKLRFRIQEGIRRAAAARAWREQTKYWQSKLQRYARRQPI